MSGTVWQKPGIVLEPASGYVFANLVPIGNPSDFSYVLPLLDKVQYAIKRVQTGPTRQIHSLAGDLGLRDPLVRQTLHERGILTVGIPKGIEPTQIAHSAQDILDILNEAGLNPIRTPYQVQLDWCQWL